MGLIRSVRRSASATLGSGPGRIWVLVGLLVAAAAWATAMLDPPSVRWDDLLPLAALTVAFVATERWVVAIRLRDRTQSLTMSEVPLVAGLFLVDPLVLIIARTTGTAICLMALRRQPPYKVAYNGVHGWLEALAALAVLGVLAPAGPLDGWRAAAVGLAVPGVTTLLGGAALVLAMSTMSGAWQRGQFRPVVAQSLGPSVATSGFALVGLGLAVVSPWLLWAPVLTVLVLYLAYRTHVRLLHLNDRQARILEFTSTTTGREGLHVAATSIVDTASTIEGVRAAGLAIGAGGEGWSWLAMAGDVAALDPAATPLGARGSTHDVARAARTHSWVLDESEGTRLVVAIGDAVDGAGDLLRTLDQIANHSRVALANAAHAAALEQQAREADARALVDPLTGLPNRSALMDGIDRAIAAGRPFATVLLDLDDFKEINDALGHAAGDRVLTQVAERMGGLVHDVLMIARLGGDEFAALVPGGEAAAREFSDRMLAVIRRTVEVPPYSLEVDASAGIALHPEHGDDRDQLLRNADLAMYEAKGTPSSVEVYGAAAAGRAVRHLAISTSFRSAIGTEQIHTVVQPKVDLSTGRLIGVEALARWTHPDLGPVSPDEFIRVAEQAGLLPQLTDSVLEHVLQWQRRWAAAGLDLNVAVNISPQGLLDADLPPRIARLLDRHGVAADRLTLEITEGSVISDPQRTLAVLGRLSRLGVQLSVDDFGTGYSSLAYLQQLPVDEIKIDRSFISPMATDPGATPLVNGIIRLCHELGFAVVAEGIETAAVQSVLRRTGCDAGQGFHIARPMPAADLLAWSARNDRAAEQADVLRVPDEWV